MDIDYYHICNLSLSKLRRNNSREKEEIFKKELQISSESSLEYIKEILKTQPKWKNEQLVGLKNSHIHFLNEEYFSIIQYFYKPKLFPTIYEDNLNILEELVALDNEEFDRIKAEYDKLCDTKIKSIEEMQGTNYTIRERENEQEVKVRVEIGGKLENLIEQDF